MNLTRDEARALRDAAAGEALAAYLRRVVLRHLARRQTPRREGEKDA